jgi:hypothetical protein
MPAQQTPRHVDASAVLAASDDCAQKLEALRARQDTAAFQLGWALSMQDEVDARKAAGEDVPQEDVAAADTALESAYSELLDLFASVAVVGSDIGTLEQMTSELSRAGEAILAAGRQANRLAV